MANIFISYARADRPRAEQLAHSLERAGWSVWWDREIPPGRSFDEVIEEALSLARCVIVLWSDASIRSEWVKTEAAEAAQRRILVPILTDGARIPLEFRRIQAAAIDDWRNLEATEGWAQLSDAVAALVGATAAAPRAEASTATRRSRRPWALAAGVALALALAVAAGAYMRSRPAAAEARPAPSQPLAASQAPAVVSTAPVPATQPVPPLPVAHPRPPRRTSPGAGSTQSPPSMASTPRPVREPVPDTAPEVRPLPIENTMVTREVVRKLDREPRTEPVAATFDVTVLYGVFRDQAGRLVVSPDGVRFHGTGDGRSFELPCGALRRVATATMIADREQRLLELGADGQAYRVRATDTGARDNIRAAIGRICAR